MPYIVYEQENNPNIKIMILYKRGINPGGEYSGTVYQGYIYQEGRNELLQLYTGQHEFDLEHEESQPSRLVRAYYQNYILRLDPNFNFDHMVEEEDGYNSFIQRVTRDNLRGNLLAIYNDAICDEFREFLRGVIIMRNGRHPVPPQNQNFV